MHRGTMLPPSGFTCSQRSVPASSTRTPVSEHTTTQGAEPGSLGGLRDGGGLVHPVMCADPCAYADERALQMRAFMHSHA
jgi:hypothetical protein